MSVNSPHRVDLEVVASLIEPRAKVLDVGCGDGALLEFLQNDKQVDGRGMELSQRGVNECVSRGLSVIQGDADRDLVFYPDKGFDYVILSQTLQATRNPKARARPSLADRPARHRVVPEFRPLARARCRCSCKGRMPVTKDLPYSWYDTPNIHFCTIRDFVDAVRGSRREGRKRHRARRQRPEDRLLDAVVVLEFFRPAGGVSAEAVAFCKAWLAGAQVRSRPYSSASGKMRDTPVLAAEHIAGMGGSA